MESNLEEKLNSTYLEHWLYVKELKILLEQLKDDDWLTPNDVHNLCIGRGEDGNIGIINFHFGEIEFWREEND